MESICKRLFSLKVISEALERLLLEMFYEEEHVEIHPTCLLTLIDSCNRSNLDAALIDQSTIDLIQRYLEFQNFVRNSPLGKSSKFWLSFLEQSSRYWCSLIQSKLIT